MVVTMPVAAFTTPHAPHGAAAVGLGIKGLLLLGRQRGIEGLGCLAAAVGFGGDFHSPCR